MALHLLSSVPSSSSFLGKHSKSTSNRSNLNNLSVVLASKFVAMANVSDQTIVRRSANYPRPIWEYDYIQSLMSDYLGESFKEEAMRLVGEVRMMLEEAMDPLEQLELIDTLQRLGISYHFQNETKRILEDIRADQSKALWKKDNLYATALEFGLLRQHGYEVNQDVFTSFMDEVGNVKTSLSLDFKGLLNLYEASYLLVEGETKLQNARDSAAKHLKQCLKQNNDHYLSMLADHALEIPLHWRVPRLEARWFIDVYQKNKDKNPIILELAILDYNVVQAMHQEDLRYISEWWKDLGLCERLSFARVGVMENYLWTVGILTAPQYGKSRRSQSKVNSILTVIDDVYDVYGTLDELELFTDAVERWDINSIERLPDYMKIFYHALYNSVNEMAFDTLKEQGVDVIPFLKKLWTNLCKAYMLEAKWYYSGYTPTLQEYMDNAWITITVPVMLGHAYLTDHVTDKGMQNIMECYPNLIYQSSMIVRLANDLGTSSYELKRGDAPKSIQCYMYESGASEEEAREHVRELVDATWKRLNKDQMGKSPFSRWFIEIAMDLARVSLMMYQNGDGHGHAIEDGDARDRVLSLLIDSIPVPK